MIDQTDIFYWSITSCETKTRPRYCTCQSVKKAARIDGLIIRVRLVLDSRFVDELCVVVKGNLEESKALLSKALLSKLDILFEHLK